jgi:hypothetical protein
MDASFGRIRSRTNVNRRGPRVTNAFVFPLPRRQLKAIIGEVRGGRATQVRPSSAEQPPRAGKQDISADARR